MSTMNEKYIFELDEIPIKDQLLSLQSKLILEFINAYPDIDNNLLLGTKIFRSRYSDYNPVMNSTDWRIVGIKSQGNLINENRLQFPAAFGIVDELGDDCQDAGYSILAPNSVIYRHTDKDNRQAKKIRIHIPIRIPVGDVGIEINGDVKTWDSIFGFNTQKLHSVWNNTNSKRVIFILDVNRERLGLPAGIPWYPRCNDNAPKFEKTQEVKNDQTCIRCSSN